jgi:hypothetical protein
MAILKTDIKGQTTTLVTSTPSKPYSEVQIETHVVVTKDSQPGAGDPYSTPAIKGVDNNGAGTPPYGPKGAKINTADSRYRYIHGGGSGLPDPMAPRQGWVPTYGCARGQNEDVINLGQAITAFQKENPTVPIPYVRQ